jgi:hypothetical protein
MATLAEVLRQARYVTPQGQVVGPRTTTAQTMSNYIRNIIPNAAQNLAQQRSDIDAALTMGDQGIQVGDRAAFERQMAQVPNLMGTTNTPRKQALIESFNKIAGGEKPVRSAVVLIGDKIYTGNTHGQALLKAVDEGVVRREGGRYIYPKNAEINSDLFMLNDGRIVDRLEASRMLDVPASESAIAQNKMQFRPANSMNVDEYMRQAEIIKKTQK